MPLPAGARLGPYEVTGLVGAGGMGEVHAARDTRLDRTVAIKILPATLAADPSFRERFEREARTLSRLNHPNICTVYDVGRDAGVDYLVMEYLEGRTLAAVLEQGPMPVDEALRVARQVADALIAAHRHGIIHRDLKPANVLIVGAGSRGGGTAKLVDFGLAKQAAVAVASTMETQVPEPTRAAPLTGTGMILGTFQYMAPEQVEGHDADARTDIWGFGCLLYEMLTGRRAFDGATQASLIAAILERQPAPVDLPDAALTPALNRLIAACLEKDPDERFQSMRDVRRELDWIPEAGIARTVVPAGGWSSRWRMAVAAVTGMLLIAGTAAVVIDMQPAANSGPPVAFTVGIPARGYTMGPAGAFGGAGSGMPAVSPDGSRIAYLAHTATQTSIWIRELSRLEPQAVRGTSGATGLFWSPDGASIGFFANGKLKTVHLPTGREEMVCDAPSGFGGSWGADGTILFSPAERSAIYRVDAHGGTPTAVTTIVSGAEQSHRWPQFLPDGRHFLFMPWSDGSTKRAVMLGSLDGAAPRKLFDSQSGGVLAGDHILFVVDTPPRVMAWGFDPQTRELRGSAFRLVDDDNVDYHWVTGEPNASAAGATLAYTTGKYRRSQLTWVDRTGRTAGTVGEPGVYFDPSLSNDGSLLAVERFDAGRGSGDIWTVDLARGAFSRLTSAAGYETTPVWSPDGRVAYGSDQTEIPNIFVKSPTGASAEEVLIASGSRGFPTDWSRDGRHVVFMLNGGTTQNDIWLFETGSRQMRPLIASPFAEGWGRISPDGQWIAYASNESQQPEIYVQSFPAGGVKLQVSTSGGGQPQWRSDGRELFYIAPDNTVMAAGIRAAPGRLEASKPEVLFTANVDQSKSIRNQYAVTPDGQRFLLLSLVDGHTSPVVAILNWRGLLRQ
jgi:eukaryotic-like serine/threonine-protein kinase